MDRRVRSTTLYPSLFMLAGAACILPLAYTINRAESERLLGQTIITRDQVALRIQSCVDARSRTVRALAGHTWVSAEELQQQWSVRAEVLHGLYDSILGLNFVDTDWRIAIIHPEQGNDAALGFDLRQHPDATVRQALTRAEASADLIRTDIVELLQGGFGFAVYQRINDAAGRPLGFADAVFRIDELMQTCLSAEAVQGRFGFQLSEPEGRTFWRLPGDAVDLHADYTTSTEVDVLGRPWILQASPTAGWIASQTHTLSLLWPGLSLGLVAALAVLLRSLIQKHATLQRNEQQFRQLVENQNDLVVDMNAAGELLYASPSFYRLFGKPEAELIGRHFAPLVHKDDLELVTQSLARLTQPPHTCYHENRAATKDGWRWLAWSCSAVLDQSGALTGITAVGRDVTELRQLEARAAQAEKMQALGNLASGISHDFNNMLHVLLANVDFLAGEHAENAALQAELKSIRVTLERAMTLVSRMVALGRNDLPRKEVIDLNVFVPEVLSLLRRTLRPAISLHVETAREPLLVKADQSQLEQVLLNLCFNARDAIADHGNIRIRLQRGLLPVPQGESQTTPTACASISVSDDGSGIPEDILPRIFDAFFTTKNDRGTGLGLPNCRSIIEQHRGEITVESTPGAGSEFRIFLPLVQAPKVTSAARSNAPGRRTTDPAPATPRGQILVVDDDPTILHLSAAMLRSAGFSTLVATNGEEALQLLALHPGAITLVLMDVLMPVLGGLEAAERMQAEYPQLPVLLMSGYAPAADRVDDRPLLHKPFTRDALLDCVSAALTSNSYSLSSDAT